MLKVIPRAITDSGPGNYESFLEYELVTGTDGADEIFKRALIESLSERIHGQMVLGKLYRSAEGNDTRVAIRTR